MLIPFRCAHAPAASPSITMRGGGGAGVPERRTQKHYSIICEKKGQVHIGRPHAPEPAAEGTRMEDFRGWGALPWANHLHEHHPRNTSKLGFRQGARHRQGRHVRRLSLLASIHLYRWLQHIDEKSSMRPGADCVTSEPSWSTSTLEKVSLRESAFGRRDGQEGARSA